MIIETHYKPRYPATLTWTNDAGVTFSICGGFEKETLLRMAESVTAD